MFHFFKGSCVAGVAAFSLLVSSPVFAHPYAIQDLRATVGATIADGVSINNSGDILAAVQQSPSSPYEVAIIRGNSVVPLYTPTGAYPRYGGIFDFNSNGQILDWYAPANTTMMNARLIDPTAKTTVELGKIPGFSDTWGMGLNDSGVAVGFARQVIEGQAEHVVAFIFKDGVLSRLPNLPGGADAGSGEESTAQSINSRGEIVGMSRGPSGRTPTIWRNGVPSALPSIPGMFTYPRLINHDGQIVVEGNDGTTHLYLLVNGQYKNLGKLSPQGNMMARAFNNQGWVIGESMEPYPNLAETGFLWKNDRLVAINDLLPPNSGWNVTQPLDFNDSGVIIGVGRLNGNIAWFVMTPQDAAVPQITALSPDHAVAGSPNIALTITGTGFDDDSVVRVGGAPQSSSRYISPTQMKVTVNSAFLTQARQFGVQITTPPPGGGSSNFQFFTVVTPPVILDSISPARIDPGAGNVTLTCTGSAFGSATRVTIEGIGVLTPTVLSPTKLTVTLPTTVTANPGYYYVRVVNPEYNNVSKPQRLTIGRAAPVISSLSPNRIGTGLASLALYVNAIGVVPGSKVTFNNGAPVTPTSTQTGRLVVSVPAFVLTHPGSYQVRVVNSIGDGGYSEPAILTVSTHPVLTAITPSSIKAGSAPVTMTLIGANFESGSVVMVNDIYTVTSTFVSSTKLTAGLPSTVSSKAGSYFVRVVNPGHANNSAPKGFIVTAK